MLIFRLFIVFYIFQQKSVDLTTIISKSQQEVEAILGKAEKVEMYRPNGEKCSCERFRYQGGQVRIIYREGKVDRIYVSHEVELLNLDKVKINSFHKWGDHVEVRVSKVVSCCPPSG